MNMYPCVLDSYSCKSIRVYSLFILRTQFRVVEMSGLSSSLCLPPSFSPEVESLQHSLDRRTDCRL